MIAIGGTDGKGLDGLAILTATIGAEILETASRSQADAFFTAVGARLAGLLRVDDIADIDMLVDRINQLWQALGWGNASLEMIDDAIMIRHYAMPTRLSDMIGDRWKDMVPGLLCGAYGRWFRMLGGGADLRTTIMAMDDALIELRHGR